MKKVWPILVSAVLFAIVAQIVHTLGAMFSMSYYLDQQYFPVWSRIMMPAAGPPPASFLAYSLLFNFIAGVIFAWFFSFVSSLLTGKNAWTRGLCFGLLLSVITLLPGYLSMFLIINLPLGLIAAWAVEGTVINLTSGVIYAALIK